MATSLDGFIARRDGSVDWLETSDEFAGGDAMDQATVEAFLATIDCYVMGSRTYETALESTQPGRWAADPSARCNRAERKDHAPSP